MLLKIKNVSFAYSSRPILKSVSLSVSSGQLLHVIGPNGVGKSTLLKLVAGFLSPDEGSLVLTPGVGIQYLHAERNFHFLKLDALSNLCILNSSLKSKAMDALQRWHLNHPAIISGLEVEKFSTGMKRKLALARLEISNAKLWLLDEPASGLDTNALDTFKSSLGSHLRQGGSAMVVSHDVGLFSSFDTITYSLTLDVR